MADHPPEAGPAPERPTSRRRPRAARPTDDEMLDAAAAVFSEAGFHAATMDVVAARARSTKPTLYAHFGSKEDLFGRCADLAADTLASALFEAYAAAADLPLEQQVRAGVASFFDYADVHPARFRLLFGAYATGSAAEARQRLMSAAAQEITRRIRYFTRRHGRGTWGTSAELCASFVVGLVVEGARHTLVADSLDSASAAEFTTQFAVAALRHIDPHLADALDARE
ncbi:TetR/AcrR family transcriptional regulator [Streptomyces sp. NPDC096153]|uniref:TetR/AcrR family transcriptional regulator n=1 Tax=Streptomyces sp. NPDC096153 TaxID=3155548 RepID=UPI0033340604